MVRAASRGVIALTTAFVITSPARAGLDEISAWLEEGSQSSALILFLIAIGGLVIGRYASRKRRDP